MNGVSLASAARRQISARSPASWAFLPKKSPSGVGDTHHVIVTAMNVQRVAGQRTGADVEDNWKAVPEIVYRTSFIRTRPWPG